jgi:hypothetical protein
LVWCGDLGSASPIGVTLATSSWRLALGYEDLTIMTSCARTRCLRCSPASSNRYCGRTASPLLARARSIVWSTRRSEMARSYSKIDCNGEKVRCWLPYSWRRISGRRGRLCLISMRPTSLCTGIRRAAFHTAITTISAAGRRVLRPGPAARKSAPLEYRRQRTSLRYRIGIRTGLAQIAFLSGADRPLRKW